MKLIELAMLLADVAMGACIFEWGYRRGKREIDRKSFDAGWLAGMKEAEGVLKKHLTLIKMDQAQNVAIQMMNEAMRKGPRIEA